MGARVLLYFRHVYADIYLSLPWPGGILIHIFNCSEIPELTGLHLKPAWLSQTWIQQTALLSVTFCSPFPFLPPQLNLFDQVSPDLHSPLIIFRIGAGKPG